MTASAAPVGGLATVIVDINSGIGEATELINVIINGAKTVLGALPSEIAAPVLAEAAEFQRWFNETINELAYALSNVGNPEALRSVGATWATAIGGTASNFAGFASSNTTRADDHWTGTAADAYTNALRPQLVALTAIKATCDEIDAVLNELANAIFNFAISVGLTVAGLVASLAVASVTAPTVVLTPGAIVAGCGAVAAFSTGIVGLITSLKEIVIEISTRSAELERRLSNNTAFYNGAWPLATTARMRDGTVIEKMSDGSITDGDDTDWHLK